MIDTKLNLPRHGLESLLKSVGSSADNPSAPPGASLAISLNAQINLRGNSRNKGFLSAARKALGQDLPLTANTFHQGEPGVFWLGPDEWLISSNEESSAVLLGRLRDHLQDHAFAATDVGAGQVCLSLTGANASDILAKGCTLDFHPDHFQVGDCAQSGLGKTSVLIALVSNAPEFRIMVRRSYADYLVRWLLHSGKEFGLRAGAAS